jgi:hypothetical protein
MKSVFIIISIVLLLFPIGATSQALSRDTHTVHIIETTLVITNPLYESTESYTTLSLDDQHSWVFQPGHPKVPMITKTFVLPFGSTIQSVEYMPSAPSEIIVQKPLIPVPEPTPVSHNQQEPLYIMDETVYGQSSCYPEKNYEISLGTGIQDGKHVSFATVRWYPIRYLPREKKIISTSEANIKFSYKVPVEKTQTKDMYDLLVIAPNEYQYDLQPLITHKNNHDVQTVFTSVETILDQSQGRDEPEKVKYYIYEAAENLGIAYVLLVGNVDKTPMRKSAIRVYHDDNILTDLYYADIYDATGGFSSWDTNNNNRFSEYTWGDGLIDEVDAYPDLYVGRLPCNNIKEVKIMVNKIITYETQTYGSEWFNRLLLLAGDTFPNHGVIEGELVTGIIADHMQQYGFEPVKLWTSLGTFRPLIINKEIKKGAGFISYSGHGYEQGFGTSPPNVEQRIEYFSPYLYGLFNDDKLPVIFFDACSTTKLDFTVEDLHEWYPKPLVKLFTITSHVPYQMDALYPCFTWEILKKVTGGGIAAVGATRVAFTGVDEDGAQWGAGFLNTHFFQAYEPGKNIGELMNQAQIDYINSVGKECISLEEFMLVGDPSLHLGGYPSLIK